MILFPLQDWSYSDGYIGSMTSRSILICLVVRVGLGLGFFFQFDFSLVLFSINAVMNASGRTTRTIIRLLSGKSLDLFLFTSSWMFIFKNDVVMKILNGKVKR